MAETLTYEFHGEDLDVAALRAMIGQLNLVLEHRIKPLPPAVLEILKEDPAVGEAQELASKIKEVFG